MQTHDTLFTPTEAAVLTGLPLKAVNNAIDKKTVSAVAGEEGGRLLDARALVSLSLERRLADRIAPELRRKVFDALAESPRNVVSLEGGLVKIDLREPRRELATSLRELRRARRLVVSDPEIMGGDPVFRGTRVPVHMIAELVAQGSTRSRVARRLSPPHGRDDPAGAGLCRRLSAARPTAQSALARSQAGAPVAAAARHHCGVVRFLIDECLSVDLVAVAGQAGHDAQHVAHVGKAGWKDWNVVRYASDGDFVLVTNNASDFRRLYAAQPLHAGLVILIPVVNRVLQQKLFRAALDELAIIGEPVNRVLEVDLDGDEVTLTLYDLPAGA